MFKRGLHYRCAHCRSRRTLAKAVEHYASPGRVPRCRGCGRRKWWRDRYRTRTELTRNLCHCHGYHFQHRRKSLWCIHAPEPPSPDAVAKRYGYDPSTDDCPF